MKRQRWLYLSLGTAVLLFLGVIYAWSIFRAPISAIYQDWTIPQLSAPFTISISFFCIGSVVAGKLAEKISIRVIFFIAAIILFCGFFAISKMNPDEPEKSLKMLCVFYGVFCGGGVGMAYNTMISAVCKWFPDKPGLPVGIMMMGYGFGGILLGSVIDILIETVGLFRTFFILALVVSAVIFIGSLIVRVPTVAQAKELIPQETKENKAKDVNTGLMLKLEAFWCFFAWAVLMSSSGLLVINIAASIAMSFGVAAVLGLIVAVFNGAGRVLMGLLFDKVGRRRTMLICTILMFLGGVSMTAGSATRNVTFIFVGLALVGTGFGGTPVVTSAFIHQTFGAKYYPANFGVASFPGMVGAIIGPLISSFLIERSGGGYASTFIMIIVLSLLNLLLWTVLNRALFRYKP